MAGAYPDKNLSNVNSLRSVNRKQALVLTVFFAVTMTAFTFLDLPLEKRLYTGPNAFGETMKIAGILPTSLAGIFFGYAIASTGKLAKKPRLSSAVGLCALILFTSFNLLSVAMLNRRALLPAAAGCGLWIAVSGKIDRRIAARGDGEGLRKAAVIALCSITAAVLGQTAVKLLFNRPRFCSLTDPDAEFRFWFCHYPVQADSSFPSGHASQAALSFLLLYLQYFDRRLRTKGWNIAFCAFATALTLGTMLSRISLGDHYPTDVTAGCALTIGVMLTSHYLVEKSSRTRDGDN